MITKNPMQLKSFIKNKANEYNISPQLCMQNYMLERLLERVSLSSYKNNFIIKGGFLISAIVGLDTRTTMDLDTTIKGLTLNHDSIRTIFEEVCSINVEDNILFEIYNISDIRETDDYPGIRVSLKANYNPISVPLTVDVTTGDIITPREIEFSFPTLFDEGSINVLAYSIETILAEKLETVLSRNIASTRPRDYYDIYTIYALYKEKIDVVVLFDALNKTIQKRGTNFVLTNYNSIMDSIRNNNDLLERWNKYAKIYAYANNLSFKDVCNSVQEIMNRIM